MVVCDLFWQFSLSGLPQNLMLLIFTGALYGVARAVEENQAGLLATKWFAMIGALFGALTLCHGLAVWPFIGLLIFALIYFRPRGFSVGVMVVVFAVVVTPWLIRNYQITGNIFGTANFWIFDGVKGSAAFFFRSGPPDLNEVSPIWWRPKVQNGILSQFGSLFGLLGSGVVAPLFFVSLLHPFKRRETAHLRWAILAMWMFAVLGMALYGLQPGSIQLTSVVTTNQLHVLFVPGMIAFGLAFLLTMVSRLSFWAVPLLQGAFTVGLFLALRLAASRLAAAVLLAPRPFPALHPGAGARDFRVGRQVRNRGQRPALGGGLVRQSQEPLDAGQVERLRQNERFQDAGGAAGRVVFVARDRACPSDAGHCEG